MALRQFDKDYYKGFIPKTGIPERVFKYYTINNNLKNSLRDAYLWFSRPVDFNDPFDCWTALVDFSNPGDYIKKIAQKHLMHLSRRDRRTKGRELANEPDKAVKLYKTLILETRQMMGVCCFTLNNDHILMWSHYANNHKGICLEFEPISDLPCFLTAEVRYTDDFKPLNYFSSEEDALFIMALTKAKVWSYECEIRVVLPLENGKILFKRPALKGIIFGSRTSQQDIDEIRKIIADSGYKEIRYRQAFMAKESFKLILKDLN